MTLHQFAEMFSLLAVQLRQMDADEATIRGYYEALKDIEPEYLAMAAKDLARSAEWFPKTSEWRLAAAKVKHQRKEHQAALLRDLAEPLCLACSDTGWALDQQERAYRCDCQELRKMELLGRRPWPKLLPASREASAEIETAALMRQVRAAVRGIPDFKQAQGGDR